MELSRSALQCCVLWQSFEPFALGCCYDSELQIAFSCAFGRFLLTHDIQQPVSRTGVHMLPLRIVLKLSVIRLTAINMPINIYGILNPRTWHWKCTLMILLSSNVTNITNKLLRPVGPLQLDLTDWDTAHAVPVGSRSCMLELQPASQPTGWYRPTAYCPTDRPVAWQPEVTVAKV